MDPSSTGAGIFNIIYPQGADLNTGRRDQIPATSMFPTEMLTKCPSFTSECPGVDEFCRFQSAYSRTNRMFGPSLGCGFVSNVECRRKNASRESTSTLKCWLQQHRKYPYPSKGEKIMLAIMTRMTMTQVSTWFANARRRIKKEGGKMGDNRVTNGNDECHDVTIDKDECHDVTIVHEDSGDVTIDHGITDDGVESPVPTFPVEMKKSDVHRKIPQRTTKLSWSVEDMVTSSVSRVQTYPPHFPHSNREPMYLDFNPIFRQLPNVDSRDSI